LGGVMGYNGYCVEKEYKISSTNEWIHISGKQGYGPFVEGD
jgi:hypothetical protein